MTQQMQQTPNSIAYAYVTTSIGTRAQYLHLTKPNALKESAVSQNPKNYLLEQGKHDVLSSYKALSSAKEWTYRLCFVQPMVSLIRSSQLITIIIISSSNRTIVNANAENLRSHFVQHEGKKELAVQAVGTRYTVDFGELAHQMTDQLHQNVVDKDLQTWILPDFSTTTLSDTIICSVLMMSTMKAYFDYKMSFLCGIPSVTLEGEKSDWERLLTRLDKLDSFGEEPTAWAVMLRPILTRFVRAFNGEPDVDFWNRVCRHYPQGSGSSYLSGWITAFCVWSSEGKWRGPPISKPSGTTTLLWGETVHELVLDNVSYPVIKSDDVPEGFCEVDVELDDNGEIFSCMMVSGHLAYSVEGEKKKDRIRPLASWFMFVKGEPQKLTPPTSQLFEEGRKKKKKPKWNWKFWNL